MSILKALGYVWIGLLLLIAWMVAPSGVYLHTSSVRKTAKTVASW